MRFTHSGVHASMYGPVNLDRHVQYCNRHPRSSTEGAPYPRPLLPPASAAPHHHARALSDLCPCGFACSRMSRRVTDPQPVSSAVPASLRRASLCGWSHGLPLRQVKVCSHISVFLQMVIEFTSLIVLAVTCHWGPAFFQLIIVYLKFPHVHAMVST